MAEVMYCPYGDSDAVVECHADACDAHCIADAAVDSDGGADSGDEDEVADDGFNKLVFLLPFVPMHAGLNGAAVALT